MRMLSGIKTKNKFSFHAPSRLRPKGIRESTLRERRYKELQWEQARLSEKVRESRESSPKTKAPRRGGALRVTPNTKPATLAYYK